MSPPAVIEQFVKFTSCFVVQFEADPWCLREIDAAVDNLHAGSYAAKRPEAQRIDFGTAQTERGDNMQREEVSAVRPPRAARPAVRREMSNDLEISR